MFAITIENAHKEIDHIFKELLPAYKMAERQEQIRLCHTMFDNMVHRNIALCDAGTGIGKTYAYLVAGVVYDHCRRVDHMSAQPILISTSSIALQTAILHEYLPLLSKVLEEDKRIQTPLRAVTRKGKSHYICDDRLAQHLQSSRQQKQNSVSANALQHLEHALDLDEIAYLSNYDKERICVPQTCHCCRKTCRYRRFLDACDKSRFLFHICNHNLWLADCIHRKDGKRPLLPQVCAVIADEAHKIPETARQMFGIQVTAGRIKELVQTIRQDGYLLAADYLANQASSLLQKLAKPWANQSFLSFEEDLQTLSAGLATVHRQVAALLSGATRCTLEKLQQDIAQFLLYRPDWICFTQEDEDSGIMLCAAPVDLTAQLKKIVWQQPTPMVLTSGTLAVGEDFRRFRAACGFSTGNRVTEFVAKSPFDYGNNCRLYLPIQPPKFSEEAYFNELTAEICKLLSASNGHALILFTSYEDMAAVHTKLVGRCLPMPLFILRKNTPYIVSQFRSSDGGVLLATGAAWEGMDFPGDCVSLLILPRLPFAYPDAIMEHEKSLQPSLAAFLQIVVVPDMQMKLKQGFGRAIRTETDTCVVAILDERASPGQRYHKDVVQTLPQMPVIDAPSDARAFLHQVKEPSYFDSKASAA